ncbi:CDP-2,3-bis-(O-geranylgeranyl)-sn-glycerol synthase [Pyrococcus sp. ST04]|uniref:CDP-2,3-bis-(O-geranylgeranyl)-sn-glycerol synthase n=1 Tax=Pyrococcus sp. ST04 TaxID=1183377 RepID=UPI00064F64A4|nr:CDP-2,3-bis-(O-geranylgeranyl)-sn-glycerol synthase [Pyrococcus sp. ST04]
MHPLFEAFWYILPAYFANSSPVVLGGGTPMDFGKTWRDGKRIFGDGKTWRGFFGGLTVGTSVGVIQHFIIPTYYGSLKLSILVAFLLSLGTLIGDLIGSFIKRRLNLPRGYPAVGLDQWGFLISALCFAYPVRTIPTGEVLFLLVVTPLIHWGTNVFAYKMGWKSVPW